jgi:MarR family transcriptional regulator for hemolysin
VLCIFNCESGMRKDLENLPDSEMLPKLLGRVIGEVSRAWRHEMNRALRPLGLNLSMRLVLLQLQRNPDGLMQADLARSLGIEGPTLVRLLDKLEQKGWIARISSAEDRRRKFTVLTPEAAGHVRIIEQLSDTLREKMMGGLNTGEIAQCAQIMTRMRNNLQVERTGRAGISKDQD